MAFSTTKGLVEIYNQSTNAYVMIPMQYIAYETYKVTPAQRVDLDSYVGEDGVLIRTVLKHTRSKIEFETPYINNTQWKAVSDIIKNGYINTRERKVKIRYYTPEVDDYREGEFYRPDIEFPIRNVDMTKGVINYDGIRIAFIEY